MFTAITKARITELHLRIFIIGLSIVLIFSFCGISLAAIWFVSADIGISGNGTTWQNAFLTIHGVADAASGGDEIWTRLKGRGLRDALLNSITQSVSEKSLFLSIDSNVTYAK